MSADAKPVDPAEVERWLKHAKIIAHSAAPNSLAAAYVTLAPAYLAERDRAAARDRALERLAEAAAIVVAEAHGGDASPEPALFSNLDRAAKRAFELLGRHVDGAEAEAAPANEPAPPAAPLRARLLAKIDAIGPAELWARLERAFDEDADRLLAGMSEEEVDDELRAMGVDPAALEERISTFLESLKVLAKKEGEAA